MSGARTAASPVLAEEASHHQLGDDPRPGCPEQRPWPRIRPVARPRNPPAVRPSTTMLATAAVIQGGPVLISVPAEARTASNTAGGDPLRAVPRHPHRAIGAQVGGPARQHPVPHGERRPQPSSQHQQPSHPPHETAAQRTSRTNPTNSGDPLLHRITSRARRVRRCRGDAPHHGPSSRPVVFMCQADSDRPGTPAERRGRDVIPRAPGQPTGQRRSSPTSACERSGRSCPGDSRAGHRSGSRRRRGWRTSRGSEP